MDRTDYVHGYSEREAERLNDQARTLTSLLHNDTRYPGAVLEAGAARGPDSHPCKEQSRCGDHLHRHLTGSLRRAEERVRSEGIENVTFRAGDLFSLPFGPQSFDHVFVCFVLEHLPNPRRALASLRPLIRPGGRSP